MWPRPGKICPKLLDGSFLAGHCLRMLLLGRRVLLSFKLLLPCPCREPHPSKECRAPQTYCVWGTEWGQGAWEGTSNSQHLSLPWRVQLLLHSLHQPLCEHGWIFQHHPTAHEVATEVRPELCRLVPWMYSITLLRVMGWISIWPCSCWKIPCGRCWALGLAAGRGDSTWHLQSQLVIGHKQADCLLLCPVAVTKEK